MARVTELIFRGTDRGVVRTLSSIEKQSSRTNRQLKGDSASATTSMAAMEKGAKRTTGAFSNMAGLVGLGGVAFGIKDVVQGGMQLQSLLGQLNGALRATGQYSGATSNQLRGMAESLSTRGGYSTPENIQALTQFISATHNVSKSQRDLTLATDISRRSGKSFSMVVRALMMLENGRTTGLARLGLAVPKVTSAEDKLAEARRQGKDQLLALEAAGYKFTTAQKAQYALTHQMSPALLAQAKAQDKVASGQQAFTQLQHVYAGATATYANSSQGRLDALKNSIKNLTDELGLALLPTVNKIVKIFTKAAEWFAKHRTLTKDLVVATAILVTTYGGLRIIQGIAGMANALKVAFIGTAAAEDDAAVGSGILAAAMDAIPILGIIAGITLLILNWKKVKAVAIDVFNWIKAHWPLVAGILLMPFIGPIGIIIGLFHKQLWGAVKDVWSWIKRNWPVLLGILLAPFTGGVSIIVGIFHKQILGAIKDAWHWIENAAGNVWNALTWPFRKAWQFISGIANKIKGVFGSIGHFFGGIGGSIAGLFHSGGIVRPKYMAYGGPAGTDTVPAWLTPGEGVVNTTGMRILGASGLGQLNAGTPVGGGGGHGAYLPVTVEMRLDGRVIARQITNVVLRAAARGPSSYSGGSLMTGAPGPVMPGT